MPFSKDREAHIIKLVNEIMPVNRFRLNRVFESDAEIIKFKNSKLLFNIDEFSSEDMLRDDDPYDLGWNLAVGGITDILASGGSPLFYAHSLVISNIWSDHFIREFSQGVADILKKSGSAFIGGDFGKSDIWRYTVAVIGQLAGEALLRSNSSPNESLYITGPVGTGNLEAILRLDKGINNGMPDGKNITHNNRFSLRMDEARVIKRYATSCIDTSDGVFNALNTISKMSHTGYYIENLPYIEAGLIVSRLYALPKTLLFLGEAGEYELLFTISKNREKDFFAEANDKGLTFYKIGETMESSIRILAEDNNVIDLNTLNIRARDYNNTMVYLQCLCSWLEKHTK